MLNFQGYNTKIYVYEITKERSALGELKNIYIPSVSLPFFYASKMTRSVKLQNEGMPFIQRFIELRCRYTSKLSINSLIKLSESDTVLYEIESIIDPDLNRQGLIIQCKTTPIPFTKQ